MQHLFQSTFLQALGFAIAYSIWQTAIVWLLYLSITGLLHRTSSSFKYRIGVAAQIISFCWFLLTFQFYYRRYTHAWPAAGTVAAGSEPQLLVSGNGNLSSLIIHWMIRGEQFLPYISMAYLLLIVLLTIRWIMGYQQTQQIRFRGLQKMPVNYRLFVARIAEQLGIGRKIQVYLSEAVTTPLTIGCLKPVILVPLAGINHLSTEQMEAVLLHELAHIKRYDYLVNMVISIAEISLFFNPFTQLLSKQIRKERENSCDDWVLQYQYNAGSYAEALLRIACLQATPALAMTATGKKNELLVRVKRMIEKKDNPFNYRKQLLAFVLVTGMLASIAWLNPIQPLHTETAAGSRKTGTKAFTKKKPAYSVEPVSAQVDNPLFNPVFFLSKPLRAEMKKNIEQAGEEITASLPVKKSGENLSDDTHWVTSISPLVATALEQASHALNQVKTDIRVPAEELIKAKEEMAVNFQKDSLFFTGAMRQKIADEISQSMEKSQQAIKQSQSALMEVAGKTRAISLDKIKMRKDIEQAMLVMKQFKSLGLDKLINEALEQTGTFLDNQIQPEGSQNKQRVPLSKSPLLRKNRNTNTDTHFKEVVSGTHDSFDTDAEAHMPGVQVATMVSDTDPLAVHDLYIDPVAGTLVINHVSMDLKTLYKLVVLHKAALFEAKKIKRVPVICTDTRVVSQHSSAPLIIHWQ